ncbi:YggT family protein [Sphaerothrix gracilis]|uniref:YggT family protein n=1 Tax=Sphaerothrix gracilis TaxID=3151835 RepID=UPI0031FC1A60
MNDRPNPNSHPEDNYRPTAAEEAERRRLQEEAERRRLHREEQYVESAQQNAIARKFEQGIYFLVGALELLLLLRFILRLSGANPANTFANVIYNLSEPFIAPFSTLFISPTFNGNLNIFDVNLLVAMLSYLVLMFLVIWLVRIISSR